MIGYARLPGYKIVSVTKARGTQTQDDRILYRYKYIFGVKTRHMHLIPPPDRIQSRYTGPEMN